jgi:hypothetical protein
MCVFEIFKFYCNFSVFERYVGCVRKKVDKIIIFIYVYVMWVMYSRIPKNVVGWTRTM